MTDLVVFDLDGTLVDSIFDLADACNFALKAFKLKENPLSDYYSFVGNGMEDLVRKSMADSKGDDLLYSKVRKVFDEYYNNHCNDKTVPYPKVAELLSALKEQNIKTAVLSNKAQQYIDVILKKCFPNHSFDLAYGQRNGISRKPHPQGLECILDELHVNKKACLFVGDSEVDVKTAQAAGVKLVAVNWGYRSEKELLNCGAKDIVGSPLEILDYTE